jgi:prepilin-type N-terminal cleavage/methylation domain-containing protein
MSVRVRAKQRGFTLMELMVVVIIVGILAVLAVPSMSLAKYDRNAYDDAGSIMMLFRSARTRAIARGGAVMIGMSAAAGTDRGTFMMYEAVTPNATGTAAAATPVATCKTPVVWAPFDATNPGIALVDGVNLNGTLEANANIQAQIVQYNGAAPSAFNPGYVCYTPLGRSYASGTLAAGMFDGQLATLNPIAVQITRKNGGTMRSVLVPPNGMARLFSQVL